MLLVSVAEEIIKFHHKQGELFPEFGCMISTPPASRINKRFIHALP